MVTGVRGVVGIVIYVFALLFIYPLPVKKIR
jgi:hypothetical protein